MKIVSSLRQTVSLLSIVYLAILSSALLNDAPAFAANFIRVHPIDGVWWFIDSHNRAFLSKGVDSVTFNQDHIGHTKDCPYAKNNLERYQTQENWRKSTATRLFSLDFNTLGAWSDTKVAQEEVKKKHLFYTVILHIADSFENWNHAGLPDFFDPKFAQSAEEIADKICAPLKDEERLIGYFGDNELLWVTPNNPLLLQYLNSSQESFGRKAALAFLSRNYVNFAEFNRTWNTNFSSWDEVYMANVKILPSIHDKEAQEKYEKDCQVFAGLAATRYFEVVEKAIKRADPNHLNLGCRFSTYPGAQVLRACASNVDVVSFNCYEIDPTKTIRRYSVVGRRLLIGEFSFRGNDSGLPNTKGAGPLVQTQKDRGDFFAAYVKHALASPFIVGYHWFEHIDEPKEGRFDGENSNYGIANIKDEPYTDLTQVMKTTNLQSQSIHNKSSED